MRAAGFRDEKHHLCTEMRLEGGAEQRKRRPRGRRRSALPRVRSSCSITHMGGSRAGVHAPPSPTHGRISHQRVQGTPQPPAHSRLRGTWPARSGRRVQEETLSPRPPSSEPLKEAAPRGNAAEPGSQHSSPLCPRCRVPCTLSPMLSVSRYHRQEGISF